MIIRNEKLRYMFLKGVVFIMAGVYIFRLADLQLVNGEKYKEIADNNMYREINIEAPRGMIYSSDMQTLASNRIGYAIDLIYTNVEDNVINKALLNLSTILIKNGENFKDTLPILITPESLYQFTFETPEDEKLWKEGNGFSEEQLQLPAKESFEVLRSIHGLDPGYTPEQARQILVFREKLKDQSFSSWSPIRVASDIKRETVYEIDANREELVGVSVTDEPIRVYPFGETAAHVLGYAGNINEEEYNQEKDTSENYSLNSTIGKTGLESAFEKELRGEIGKEMTITDYRGRPQYEIMDTKIPATPGNNLVTTFDLEFQKSVEEILAGHLEYLQNSGVAPKAASGSAVVLDVNTGAVLAMASMPTYDPNLFTTTISDETWNALNVVSEEPLIPKPLYNNSTLTALQPGSAFKPLVGLAGLETGTVVEDSSYFCNGKDPHIPTFTCLGYHGYTSVVNAIRDSCNVYFYETGYNMGIDPIVKYGEAFGLGNATGIEIYESTGTLSGRDNPTENWSLADTMNAAIGQGGNSFTPLQMANYISTLANGGNHYETYLVKQVTNEKGEVVINRTPKLINQVSMKPENLTLIKEGMKKVVTDGAASRYFSGFDHENIGVGGKTGTAEYGDNSVTDTSWFVCFSPYENPEIAISVMIIEGDTSLNAVPVAREILDTYYAMKNPEKSEDSQEVTP